MMYKRLALILAVMLLFAPCRHASGIGTEAGKVLLIGNAVAGSLMEPAVRQIASILTYMGKDFDLVPPEETVDLKDYGYILVLIGSESKLAEDMVRSLHETGKPVLVLGEGGLDQLADDIVRIYGYFEIGYGFEGKLDRTVLTSKTHISFLKEPEESYGGTVRQMQGSAYPLCARRGHVSQIAWFDADPPWMPYAASDLIAKWMWPYENTPPQYGTYLVLDSVYPFEDLKLLMQASDMLNDEGVPYAIMVMPVYDNAGFPAMKRFCEYLRYAQSKGAAIVLRMPLTRLNQAKPDELRERIKISYEAYAQYGVYPLALAAPEACMYTEAGLAVLRGVSTVMLLKTDDEWLQSGTNLAYQDGHAFIAPACPVADTLLTNVYPTAVLLNLDSGLDALKKSITAYRNSVIPLSSLWSLNNTLYIGSHVFSNNKDGAVYYDSQRVSLDFQPFVYDQNYKYQRGFMFYLADQIEASNRIILALVLFFSVVLLFLIWEARRRMKRQFLLRPPADVRRNDREVDK